jgi:hypothetical protein
MMLDNVGLSLCLLRNFIQHRATLLAQQFWMMLASFEHALTIHFLLRIYYRDTLVLL